MSRQENFSLNENDNAAQNSLSSSNAKDLTGCGWSGDETTRLFSSALMRLFVLAKKWSRTPYTEFCLSNSLKLVFCTTFDDELILLEFFSINLVPNNFKKAIFSCSSNSRLVKCCCELERPTRLKILFTGWMGTLLSLCLMVCETIKSAFLTWDLRALIRSNQVHVLSCTSNCGKNRRTFFRSFIFLSLSVAWYDSSNYISGILMHKKVLLLTLLHYLYIVVLQLIIARVVVIVSYCLNVAIGHVWIAAEATSADIVVIEFRLAIVINTHNVGFQRIISKYMTRRANVVHYKRRLTGFSMMQHILETVGLEF